LRLGLELERGRENNSFPVVEELKPQGVKAQGAKRLSSEVSLSRSKRKIRPEGVFFCKAKESNLILC